MNEALTDTEFQLGLVGADEEMETSMRQSCCGPPHTLAVLGVAAACRQMRAAPGETPLDAMLVAWPARAEAQEAFAALVQAPRRLALPLVALCRDDAQEHARALRSGADEALPLPLSLPLLAARLAVRRRLLNDNGRAEEDLSQNGSGADGQLRLGRLLLDEPAQQVRADGTPLDLTPKEFDLLSFMIRRAGACCTRGQILDHVWGIDFDTGTNMVDVYVHFLRQKLGGRGLSSVIRTVRGKGYRLVAPPEQ